MKTNPQNFYFTFGSWEGFPFQNGYLVITAVSRDDAIETFRQYHPDVHNNIVNCSFIYNENQWQDVLSRCNYSTPFEALESRAAQIAQKISEMPPDLIEAVYEKRKMEYRIKDVIDKADELVDEGDLDKLPSMEEAEKIANVFLNKYNCYEDEDTQMRNTILSFYKEKEHLEVEEEYEP